MKTIINYMNEAQLSTYVYNQRIQIENALNNIDKSWIHSYLIKDLLKQTRYQLNDMGKNVCSTNAMTGTYERKIEKYTSWMEVQRLIKFQFGRFSIEKESYSEGLYATLISFASRFFKCSGEKKIAVLGCGPGRTVADLAYLYPECIITGLDYSLLSLVVAKRILLEEEGVFEIPIRSIDRSEISSIMTIPVLGLKNIELGLFDLMNESNLKYDLIVVSNTINLMPDHHKAMDNLGRMINHGGIVVYADLIGWRMDRKPEQKVLCSMNSIKLNFENRGFETLDYFKGGPYIEVESMDNKMVYTEYFYVGKKK